MLHATCAKAKPGQQCDDHTTAIFLILHVMVRWKTQQEVIVHLKTHEGLGHANLPRVKDQKTLLPR